MRSLPWIVLAALAACSSNRPADTGAPPISLEPDPAAAGPAHSDGVLVGVVERATIEAEEPAWHTAVGSATPDPEASRALATVEPGARVDVVLGTWCGDSRREVPRFWAALDLAGDVPFDVRHVAVDRAKDAPGDLLDGLDIEYVPTFIVYRNGDEIGRIVESAPGGIESDLLSLLRGERTGVITGRGDL